MEGKGEEGNKKKSFIEKKYKKLNKQLKNF
jgi:hypothetical protein